MTPKEAAVVTAYTGIMIGEFETFHKYATEKLERPIFSNEMVNSEFWEELRLLSKKDFISIKIQEEKQQ